MSPYRVLLIDEDPRQTELHSGLIREVADCQIDVMSRVSSPLDWTGRSIYHLVVIDMSKDIDGLALLEGIKRSSPLTGVILISDQATVEQAVSAVRMGAEDYFKKPFSPESFQLAVKRGLDRKAVFDASNETSSYLNLLNSCQMISASLEQAKIFGIVQAYLGRELRSNHSAIYRLADTGEAVRVPDTSPGARDRAMEEILDIALVASNPLAKMSESGELCRFVERGQLTPGLFIFRFRCVGNEDYFCVCLSPERPGMIDAWEGRLRLLRAQIEVTGRNIQEYLGVQNLAYVDDATGLYNTRYLNNILDREIATYETTKLPFAILFIDVDKFKGVNDTHGHLVGTKILNALGEQLRKFVRGADTVFRYGGDEFVAVLSPSDLPTAQSVAERIRQSVEQMSFLSEDGLDIRFTVSIGVALYPEHAKSKKAVIDAADKAMYAAKKTTRNRVFIAELPEAEVQPGLTTDLKPSKKKAKKSG
jgi:diguanylate cyclase (GGDEF)-like protein